MKGLLLRQARKQGGLNLRADFSNAACSEGQSSVAGGTLPRDSKLEAPTS